MTPNRNIKTNFETAVANPQIEVVDITERLRDNDFWFETIGMSTPPAVIAFFAGIGWGRSFVELSVIALSPNLAAVTFGFSFALVVYLFVLVLHVLTTTNRYYAAKNEEEEAFPDGFIQTGASHQQQRFITGEMKKVLKTFARRYPEVKTLGINRWENGKPFTRAQYHQLMAYLETIKAVERAGRGRTLTAFGESKLADWAVGKFDNSPRPNSAASHTYRSAT